MIELAYVCISDEDGEELCKAPTEDECAGMAIDLGYSGYTIRKVSDVDIDIDNADAFGILDKWLNSASV